VKRNTPRDHLRVQREQLPPASLAVRSDSGKGGRREEDGRGRGSALVLALACVQSSQAVDFSQRGRAAVVWGSHRVRQRSTGRLTWEAHAFGLFLAIVLTSTAAVGTKEPSEFPGGIVSRSLHSPKKGTKSSLLLGLAAGGSPGKHTWREKQCWHVKWPCAHSMPMSAGEQSLKQREQTWIPEGGGNECWGGREGRVGCVRQLHDGARQDTVGGKEGILGGV
jgi:hypothetical protein